MEEVESPGGVLEIYSALCSQMGEAEAQRGCVISQMAHSDQEETRI